MNHNCACASTHGTFNNLMHQRSSTYFAHGCSAFPMTDTMCPGHLLVVLGGTVIPKLIPKGITKKFPPTIPLRIPMCCIFGGITSHENHAWFYWDDLGDPIQHGIFGDSNQAISGFSWYHRFRGLIHNLPSSTYWFFNGNFIFLRPTNSETRTYEIIGLINSELLWWDLDLCYLVVFCLVQLSGRVFNWY